MNNSDFNKGIADIRRIRLSEKEKTAVLRTILRDKGKRNIPSPYWSWYAVAAFVRGRALYALALLLALLAAGSGTAVLAAEGSVPGDFLYPIKVGVTEPALDRLYSAPEERASWEGEKAARRLREAETLALSGRLDEKTSEALDKKIREHNEAFRSVLSDISTTTAPKARENVEVEYESKIKAHSKIVNAIRENLGEEARATVARLRRTLDEELEGSEKREEERRERRYTLRDEKEGVTEESLRERLEELKDAEKTIERVREVIEKEKEKSELRGGKETLREDVLHESERLLEETRNNVRSFMDSQSEAPPRFESPLLDLQGSKRKALEAGALIEEVQKIKVEKRTERKEREKREKRDADKAPLERD